MEDLNHDAWLCILSFVDPCDIQRLAMTSVANCYLVTQCWRYLAICWANGREIAHRDTPKETALSLKAISICEECKSKRATEHVRYPNPRCSGVQSAFSYCDACFRGRVFISKSECKRKYKLTDADLNALPHSELPSRSMNICLFVESVVLRRAHQKHGGPDGLAAKVIKCEQLAMNKRRRKQERDETERVKRRKMDK